MYFHAQDRGHHNEDGQLARGNQYFFYLKIYRISFEVFKSEGRGFHINNYRNKFKSITS